MDNRLTVAELESYRSNGYLFPLEVFNEQQVQDMLADLARARDDAKAQGFEAETASLIRANVHLLLPFVSRVARSPQLLDRVESIRGPNLLLWSAEFFIKAAHTDKIVSWHQDLTYWGLGDTDDEITAWIALSEVTVESGCMRV